MKLKKENIHSRTEFLVTSGAKPKHIKNVIYSKTVHSVSKKRAEIFENVVIHPHPTIPPLRLPHMPSFQPDNDNDTLQHLLEIHF